MNLEEMRARALALQLGKADEIKKMSEAALTALLRENDPEFKAQQTTKAASKGDIKRAPDDPRTGVLVKCRIEATSDPDGKFDVFACVNGYNIQAKRNQEIELDEGFVKHLQSLYITDVEAEVVDGKPTGRYVDTDRPRFPITLL